MYRVHCRLVGVSQNALRVVIAEDEALIRLDLKEMLEEEGYSVVAEAGDGEAAVERVLELRPDLAIFDVKMPVLDGIPPPSESRPTGSPRSSS